MRRTVDSSRLPPNNSFKPNLLRYTKHMAEKACHVFGSATQVGLTQALAGMNNIATHCANCQAPMSMSVLSLAPLQLGSKRATFICNHCNKPSILNGRSRLAGAVVSVSVLLSAVALASWLDDSGVMPVVVLVVGALGGMAAGAWVSSLMPALVR